METLFIFVMSIARFEVLLLEEAELFLQEMNPKG